MRRWLSDRRPRGERGAIAILTAFLAVIVCVVAAVGVDISVQVKERQQYHDTIDAAAHAGAFRLPGSGTTAATDAQASWEKNDPTLVGAASPPANEFFCVVRSLASGVPGLVDTTQIPATCDPASRKVAGTPPTYTGSRCNTNICSIPCFPASGDACNTLNVTGTKPVPFTFAPVIGIPAGSTGSVSSAACKGSCGTIPLNPMDVAVVADRTGSMATADVAAMIGGIKGMFGVMTPSQQYVALGTIGRSILNPAQTTCTGSPLGSTNKARSQPAATGSTTGPWMPEAFSDNYLTGTPLTINASSTLVHAVECLRNQNSGTALAAPMKAASRLLLGMSTSPETVNNIGTGTLTGRTGTVRKAIIFETDGEPYELQPTGGSTTLNVNNDIISKYSDIIHIGSSYYYNGGDKACQNLLDVATNAKAVGILVVTVGFNLATADCDDSDLPQSTSGGNDCSRSPDKVCDWSKYATGIGGRPSLKLVRNVLAAAATNSPLTGLASDSNSDCSDTTKRTTENTDGDYFFCAAAGSTSSDMAAIYKTAFTQLATGIRIVALP